MILETLIIGDGEMVFLEKLRYLDILEIMQKQFYRLEI